MNAVLEIPSVPCIDEGLRDPIRDGRAELVYRALLLSISPSEAAFRLNLPANHGMWLSEIYRELARTYVLTRRGSVIVQPRGTRRGSSEAKPPVGAPRVRAREENASLHDLRWGQQTAHAQNARKGCKGFRTLNAVFDDLRSCLHSSSSVRPVRVAKLLFEAASLYRFHDPLLLGRLLDEVDVIVFRGAWSDDSASR